jgi:hypothetical protein
MQLTNRLRLPEPIVAAVTNDSYTKGSADISVTGLLNPPQINHLLRQHSEELTEDVSDRIWSLLGQAVHSIIERASDQADVLSETTVYSEYLGWKIKGTCDHVTISTGELCDYKTTTVWKVLNNQPPTEWVQQTNVYRRMLHKEHGIQINSIAVIAILRDWSKREATRRADYPQAQVVRLEIPLWSDAEADAFITERVALHQLAVPPMCSDADIWAKPSKWALMRKGAARAVKLFDTQAEAQEAVNSANLFVEHRPGQATRCESYCPVAQWCPQWAADPRRPTSTSVAETLF